MKRVNVTTSGNHDLLAAHFCPTGRLLFGSKRSIFRSQFWGAVLLFHHRSRPAQDSTLQRDTRSRCSLDRPTVAGGVPYTPAHRFLLLDRDAKFGNDVVTSAKEMGSKPVCTDFRSRWQNGVAERWVGSCRRDLLDHVIILNERHLMRLMSEYVRCYHEDRPH